MDKRYLALSGIILISSVAFMEYTVVNTALPTIQKIFHVSVLNLQWVFNIYSLVVALFMVIFGRLGDIYGRRLVFYFGALALAVGSLGAGLAYSFSMLIFFRAVQSLGVAATITLAASLINHIFKEKAQFPMSIYGIFTGVALAAGPYIGGTIVMHWGWPWIFYINIPLLIIAIAFCLPYLEESKNEEKISIDVIGVILFAATLVPFIYGLIRSAALSWSDPLTLVCFVTFIIAAPILIWHENKQEHPILNFHFFKKYDFLLGALSCVTGGVLISSAIFFSPLYLQNVMGYTPKEAGLLLLTIPIAIVFFAPLIGSFSQRYGTRPALFIAYCMALVTAILFLIFSHKNILTLAIAAFLLSGFCWTFTNVLSSISVAKAVPSSKLGVAVGTIFSMWNIAAAITIAITTLLFHIGATSKLAAGSKQAFIAGFQNVFIFVTAAMILIIGISIVGKFKCK